jgi:hypothetical protein
MRLVLLIIIFFFSQANSYSQRFVGGITAGASISQVDGDGMEGYNKAGLIFGGFVNRKLAPKLRAQLEMIYIGKGSKKGANPSKGIFDYRRISLHYVEVPVVFQFWYDKFNLTLEGGLSYGVLISSKEEDEYGETTLFGPFNKNEVGLKTGVSYALSDAFSVTLRFAYSILPIANETIRFQGKTYGGSYNNLLSLQINYSFSSPE